MALTPRLSARLYFRWLLLSRYLQRRQGFIWRTLLAWTIGTLMFISDDLNSIDTRLQARGNQRNNSQLVLLTLNSADLNNNRRQFNLMAQDESTDLSDNFFWDRKLWYELLQHILKQRPKAIGVSLVFAKSILTQPLTSNEDLIFHDPRIVWATTNADQDNPQWPAFARDDRQNIADISFLRDEDGVIRRFNNTMFDGTSTVPHMSLKLAAKTPSARRMPLINFRGDTHVYPEISVTELLNDDFPPDYLHDKIVLLGIDHHRASEYITPLGPNNRLGVLAAMTDHILNEREIQRLPSVAYVAILLALCLFTIAIITQIPHSIAVLMLIGMGTIWTSLSVWIFDSLYFWLPITSVLGTMISSYVLLLGYQANNIERKHFLLKQEQDYLRELEQLKNNFVSLISHDLKTPIAKIQAIVDRMSIKPLSEDLRQDLAALQQSNEELNSYIQSVLKMLRVESREFRLSMEVSELNDIILEVVSQLSPLADAKSIRIETHLEPLFSMEFDPTLIREVLVNLIDNAIKYSNPNGSVQIHSTEMDQNVIVEVTDNGCGIAPEDLPMIWGKFVRGKGQDLKTKGSGLGLYLVKFFVELHGGRVFADSTPGVGTKIGISLPLNHHDPDVMIG